MENFEGKLAIEFTLPDQDGHLRNLNDFLGKYVLLYFYPKDMTPGCTKEAQCFRDRLNDLSALNVQVLGVSPDSVESHKKFAEAHGLNFPILSDEEKKVVEAYGVGGVMGVKRESFLINPEGVVVKHYKKVKPAEHVEEVIRDVESL